MAAEQLCFFKFPRPLLERFGKDFFRSVPEEPGVYIFRGENSRPLYVGHSRDLRSRLSYYKNAQPEREPKRIVRLVHQVRTIDLECCGTVESAQVRELALIRQLRPRYNVANTLSPTFSFFGFRSVADGFALRLSMSEARFDGEEVVGGFKNRGLCARSFIAFARTITAAERSIDSVYGFPARLNSRAREWQIGSVWRPRIESFVRAENPDFLQNSMALAEAAKDPFIRQVFEADLLALGEFYSLAQEMASLRRAREASVLSQEALQVSGRLKMGGEVQAT